MITEGQKNRSMDIKDPDSSSSRLAHYDNVKIKEVEALRQERDSLSKESEVLSVELKRLREEYEDKKARLISLHAEEATHKKELKGLQNDILLYREELLTLKNLYEDTYQIEKEFNDYEELISRQNYLRGELEKMETGVETFNSIIADNELQLREMVSVVEELEVRRNAMAGSVAGLERIVTAFGGADGKADEKEYADELVSLRDGLLKKDEQAISLTRDIIDRLVHVYGDQGDGTHELLKIMSLTLSRVQEVGETERHDASMKAEFEAIQKELSDRTASLNEIKGQNSENKKKIGVLENEIKFFLKNIAMYADEMAIKDEMKKQKEARAAEFMSLFVQIKELQDRILTVDSKLKEFREFAG